MSDNANIPIGLFLIVWRNYLLRVIFLSCFFSLFIATQAHSEQHSEGPTPQPINIQNPQVELTKGEMAWIKEHPEITLAGGISFAPFIMPDNDGNAIGYDVDIANLVAKKTGLKIRFELGTWSEIQERAKNREFDGLTTANITKERKNDYNASLPYIHLTPLVIVKRGNPSGIRSIDDISGKRVVLQRGNAIKDILGKEGKEFETIYVDSIPDMIEAIVSEKADFTLFEESVFYVARQLGLVSMIEAPFTVGEGLDLHFLLRNDQPELLTIVDKGLKSITHGEMLEIRKRWFDYNTGDFRADHDKLYFSKAEQDWLAQNHVVRVRLGNYAPIQLFDKKPSGIAVDYFNAIAEKIGIQVEYQMDIPWMDALNQIRNCNGIDLLLGAVSTTERREYMTFTDVYLSFPSVIFTREDSDFVSSLQDLSGKVVAVQNKIVVHDLLVEKYPDLKLLPKDTEEAALRSLVTGESDAYVGNLTVGSFYIQSKGWNNAKVAAPTGFDPQNLSMAMRNDWPELASIINKVLATFTLEESIAIREKWITPIRYEYGISTTDVLKWVLGTSGIALVIITIILIWNKKLAKEITARKEVEQEKIKLIHNLGERVKELDCLYGISNIVENNNTEEILQGTVNLIPPSWQYPESICAKIKLDGQEYSTDNFTETEWLQTKEIVVFGEKSGEVNVYYLEEKPEVYEGPFLKEERNLIDAIAERLGYVIEMEQTEDNLKKSEKKFKNFVMSAEEGFVLFDSELNLVTINAKALEIYPPGSTRENLSGKNILEIAPYLKGTERYEKYLEVKNTGKPFSFDDLVPGPIFGDRHLSLKAFQVDNGLGIIFSDITERKQAEEKIKQYSENLESMVFDRTEELQKTQTELLLKDRLASIGKLAGSVAHDIRNPLGVISNSIYFLNQIGDDEINEPIKKHITIMDREINRANDIIADLMDFSRENRPAMVERQVNDVIEKLLERIIFPEKVTVETELDPALPLFPFDSSQIQRVVQNLITNACQAMTEKGTLHISSSKVGEFIVLKIQDTGTGIKSEEVENIFEPLFTTKSKGVGLGLSIVKTFIEKHNATVEVESEVGKGTTFTIKFPQVVT